MGEEEKNPNPIMYILPELLGEIFIRLSLKSILKCRTVSKQWRTILESRGFVGKRMDLQKKRRILAACNCDCGRPPRLLPEARLVGDEEIVYLHCNAARPSMSCEGLICFPEQDWIIVLNPTTRQLRRFPSGLNPDHKSRYGFGLWSSFSPGHWAMGFGRDKVTGRYKVVRMCFSFRKIGQPDPVVESCVLDVQTGEWRKLCIPPHVVIAPGSQSVCVNGSIYWLHIDMHVKLFALDLHKQVFCKIPLPRTGISRAAQMVNLDGRLAIAETRVLPEWKLEVWSKDTAKHTWSRTYYISLVNRVVSWDRWGRWFTPLAVSKQGNLIFHDNQNRLFKYYPRTDDIRVLSEDTCVISLYSENLVPLPIKPSHPHPDPVTRTSICRLFLTEPTSPVSSGLQRNESRILEILFASLIVAGFIWSPRKW